MYYFPPNECPFSTGEERAPYFWLLPVSQWSVILSVSANSMEVAVLGALDAEQQLWVQWMQASSDYVGLVLRLRSIPHAIGWLCRLCRILITRQ